MNLQKQVQKASKVLFTTYPARKSVFTLGNIKTKLQKADNNIRKAYKSQSITNEKIDELIQLIIIRLGYNPQGIHYFLDKDKAIILYEVWDSRDHQEKYIKWREDTGVLKTIGEMCRERPVFKFVDFLF